ncbi:CvpA family protein [Psychrobacter sp. I-STPA6b]|uniref:CvpA family protein n=1 Tax=Psychrobacter sp. I-STPA6b TaxID=2585718 RepID=UPI001D0C0429|nr:CvpA family protein [Psychrobacter sp. I-STPA6b]
MSIFDLIIALLALIGLWRGFQLGFIKTMIGLVGWFIALVAATRLADDVAPQMSSIVDSPVLQTALGFLVVVLVVMVMIHLIGFIASSAINSLKLGILDKMAGAIAGVAKNLLVVLVLLSVLSPVLVQTATWQESYLAQELMPYAPLARQLATEVLGDAWQQLNHP